jgi:hypothetical protein
MRRNADSAKTVAVAECFTGEVQSLAEAGTRR